MKTRWRRVRGVTVGVLRDRHIPFTLACASRLFPQLAWRPLEIGLWGRGAAAKGRSSWRKGKMAVWVVHPLRIHRVIQQIG
jgi:hypothetical protein